MGGPVARWCVISMIPSFVLCISGLAWRRLHDTGVQWWEEHHTQVPQSSGRSPVTDPRLAPFFKLRFKSCFLQQDPLDPYVEVLGRVDQDLTITVERIVNYGTDFGGCGSLPLPHHYIIKFSLSQADLGAYNEVVQLAANFPQLFSPTHSQAKNEMDMQFWHHAYNNVP